MTLHGEARALLDLQAAARASPIEQLLPDAARRAIEALTLFQGAPEPMLRVEDLKIPGPDGKIDLRIFVPHNASGRSPIIHYLHGGGWTVGSLDLVDRPCRALAARTGAIVAASSYRLAPENRYPAAHLDARAAISWLHEQRAKIAHPQASLVVMGDSAGGNLAAAGVIDAVRERSADIGGLILLYPVTDFIKDSPSYREMGEGYSLTTAAMRWFWSNYLGDRPPAGAGLARLLAQEIPEGHPPVLVAVAGYDPLRDEGLAYAAKLQRAGAQVLSVSYADHMHGFFWTLGATPSAGVVLDDIGKALRIFAA